MLNEEIKTNIEQLVRNILSSIGVEILTLNIEIQDGSEIEPSKLKLDITTDHDSILVGHHGQTLDSLQHFVNLFVNKNYKDDKFYIILDIASYKKAKEEKLRSLARDAMQKVVEIGKSISLYPMNSFERKIVHEEVATDSQFTSYSEGEGFDRKVIIAQKPNELSS